MERAARRLNRQRPVGVDLHGASVRMNHRLRHVRAGRHEQLVLQFSAGVVHPHVDAVVQSRVADAAEGGAVRLHVAGITRGALSHQARARRCPLEREAHEVLLLTPELQPDRVLLERRRQRLGRGHEFDRRIPRVLVFEEGDGRRRLADRRWCYRRCRRK